jgi:hypothetical protein
MWVCWVLAQTDHEVMGVDIRILDWGKDGNNAAKIAKQAKLPDNDYLNINTSCFHESSMLCRIFGLGIQRPSNAANAWPRANIKTEG